MKLNMGEFPSGQRGQTVNLLSTTSVVRIHPLPPSKGYKKDVAQETPDFIGGFAVSTAEKTTSDFVDVKKILFPF